MRQDAAADVAANQSHTCVLATSISHLGLLIGDLAEPELGAKDGKT